MRFFLLFLLFPLAFAHRGFERLAWQEDMDAYTLSVLGDFHTDAEDSQLFVQLSRGREAVPEGTTVNLELSHQDTLIYTNEVPFLATSSDDGKTVYSGYLATFPLNQAGFYEVDLSISGPLGAVDQTYGVVTQRGVSWLEYLPSALILLICVAGASLLFVPVRRKETREIPVSDNVRS